MQELNLMLMRFAWSKTELIIPNDETKLAALIFMVSITFLGFEQNAQLNNE